MPPIAESDLVLNADGSVYHLNLKPQNIADTIITVGDPGRVHRVSEYFDDVDFEMNRREFITHTGYFKGKRLTVISTGMGTDNIEIVLTELDALVNIDLKKREPKSRKKKLNIIRIGTSGGLQEDIKLGDHLVTDYAVGLDSTMGFYNIEQSEFEEDVSTKIEKDLGLHFKPYCVSGSEELKKQFGTGMRHGNTITTPGFYGSQGRKLRAELRIPDLIKKLNYFHYRNFWVANFDMETAGYYAMARLLGHELISLNGIVSHRLKSRFSKKPDDIIDGLISKVMEKV